MAKEGISPTTTIALVFLITHNFFICLCRVAAPFLFFTIPIGKLEIYYIPGLIPCSLYLWLLDNGL